MIAAADVAVDELRSLRSRVRAFDECASGIRLLMGRFAEHELKGQPEQAWVIQ